MSPLSRLATPAPNLLLTPLSLLVLFASLQPGCSNPARVPRAPAPGEAALRVMTYNVNYGLAGDPATIDAIAGADADVVLLQETSARWEVALRARLGDRYPHMAFHHAPAAGGMGVLSRLPLEGLEWLRPPAGGWFVAGRVVVVAPLGRVQILNLHLHPPISEGGSVVSGYFTTPAVREQELQRHFGRLRPGEPTLVVGDFNEGAGGRALRWLQAQGYGNALQDFQPGADTWRWTTSVGTVRTQLDHLAYDERLLTPLRAEVLSEGRSDHLPVVATFVRRR